MNIKLLHLFAFLQLVIAVIVDREGKYQNV